MELRHLRYFVAVAAEENISRAAKRLHISQPPLSRQIRDLEDELRIALFERSAKSVQLTPLGKLFLVEARAALQRVDDAVAFIRAAAERKNNHLRVAHTNAIAIELLPRVLRAFQRKHKGTTIELSAMTTQLIVHGLQSGSLDIALTVGGEPEKSQGLCCEKVGSYGIQVATHRRHRFARLKEVPLREVAREPVIALCRNNFPWYSSFVTSLLKTYNHSFSIVEEHDNAQSVIAAVEAGRGVALFYETIAKTVGLRVTLRRLIPSPRSPIVLLYRDEGMTPLMEEFLKAARSVRRSSRTSCTLAPLGGITALLKHDC